VRARTGLNVCRRIETRAYPCASDEPDPSIANGALALPAGHPFQAVPIGSHWTATRHVYASQSTAEGMYYVTFGGGGLPGAIGEQ